MIEREYWVCASLAVVVVVLLIWYLQRSRYRQLGSKIPGPPGLPLLGNVMAAVARSQDVVQYSKELRDRYGRVCRMWLGPHLLVGLGDPEDVAIVFSSSRTLSKPSATALLFGNSLLTAETQAWKKFREIMSPTFTRRIIDSYVNTFYEKSQVMSDRLEKHSGKEPFDVADYTIACMMDTVTETSLGVPVNIQDENRQHCVVRSLVKTDKVGTYVFFRPWLRFTIIIKLAQLYKNVLKLVKPMHYFLDAVIKHKTYSYLNSSLETPVKSSSKQQVGFLEQMISRMVNNPGLFSADEVRDQIMFVMAAATDTTAYTVAYTLMLLGLHQDVQMKVLREQEDIFGEDMQRPVTARDLKQMVYLEQVINETMRLYPVIPIIGRRVDEDVRIKGYTLPAGTTIVIPIYVIHRDPAYFPDPDRFDPDRFSYEHSACRPSYSFIPFASGSRMCIGKYYAYMAMKTLLSVLLRRYEVLKYGSRDDMESLQFQFILKMANGHRIKLGPRKRRDN